ncbi:protein FAR1-RELATED SEQUENCE 4-like [Magnolia sinica]|uniref:protein FAR1-RELATED SEQUENCE 4-like n=1 Tax=Magnolia sinica TaxID=86752 RepID=UPI0026587CA3|nr:protein FAR1-RELATED SEQUENCE 4-like [Magnolia sinica]
MEMENTECRLAVDVEAFVCEDEAEKNSTMRASIGIEDVELGLGGDEMEEKSPARESIVNKEDAIREPSVGMEFETEQALYLFYKEYARRVGFSVTKRSTRYSKKDNTLIAGLYVCSRQGFKVEKENIVNPRPVTRVGCKAMIKAKRMDSKKWKIFNFVKEHNHELSPGNVYSLRSHKKVPKSQKNVIRKPQASRIETENIVSSMAKQSNGINKSGPIEKQRRNPIEKERRKSLAGEDAQSILKHCMRMHVLNPAFYYAVEVDEEQQPRSVFWVDARSRTAFTYFGDVVTFDTAYLTNRYNVPLALFVGVNHHGQSVLFGCALLADETKESFVWLFKTWLAAMSGRPPKALITDQDRAIKAAITEVFPETHHRLCLWHVLKRVAEKLGYICRVDLTFIDKLHNCVYDSLTIDEFEMRWDNLIKDFNLGQHPWVLSLYKDRQLWVPVYLKDTFFAGMSSSHPHEIIDSFFDAYVSPKTTLKEFINNYEIALENRYKKEVQADLETSHTAPSLRTPSPFEKQAASIYTREIFKKFQVEVFGMSACSISFVQLEGAITTYIVKEWEDIEKLKGKDYRVLWNGSEIRVSCICRLFEFKGFLCRHALVVLLTSGVPKIPSHYILKRWTKEMRNRHVSDECRIEHACVSDPPKTIGERYNDLCQRFIKFAEEGSLSEESYIIVLYELQKAMQKVADANNNIGRLAPPGVKDQLEQGVPSLVNHYSMHDSWQQMGREYFEHIGSCEPVYHIREPYQ